MVAVKRKAEAGTGPARKTARKQPNKPGAEQATATATATATPAQAANLPKQAISTASPDADADYNQAPKQGNNDSNPETITTTTVQIITGSYERVLHGFTAAIPHALLTASHDQNQDDASTSISTASIPFADTFLFNAHASAIRCLALSPVSDVSPKITLATGSTDERINLYTLSTVPPKPNTVITKASSKTTIPLPSLHPNPIASNPTNRTLGSLMHHSSPITQLYFPTRAKLLSSAQDNHITITRTRDWTPLSTIKSPIPKPQGRPSGDTAAPGEVPCGINSFALHPSMKLMLSVGRGEKCMRLWNLVTGRKAGVLNFHRGILEAVGEGRFGTGEAQKVVWDAEGEEFCVAFERGAVVFGIDSKPKGRLVVSPRSKVQEVRYVDFGNGEKETRKIVALSTEDGRIMFYDTASTTPEPAKDGKETSEIAPCALVAQLGGPAAGITSRIKDFSIIPLTLTSPTSTPIKSLLIITASSDGSVRFWTVAPSDLESAANKEPPATGESKEEAKAEYETKEVGRLIGTYTIGVRITCMTAFVMTGQAEDVEEEEQRGGESSGSSSEEESGSE
jgi:protein MAK11